MLIPVYHITEVVFFFSHLNLSICNSFFPYVAFCWNIGKFVKIFLIATLFLNEG